MEARAAGAFMPGFGRVEGVALTPRSESEALSPQTPATVGAPWTPATGITPNFSKLSLEEEPTLPTPSTQRNPTEKDVELLRANTLTLEQCHEETHVVTSPPAAAAKQNTENQPPGTAKTTMDSPEVVSVAASSFHPDNQLGLSSQLQPWYGSPESKDPEMQPGQQDKQETPMEEKPKETPTAPVDVQPLAESQTPGNTPSPKPAFTPLSEASVQQLKTADIPQVEPSEAGTPSEVATTGGDTPGGDKKKKYKDGTYWKLLECNWICLVSLHVSAYTC